MSSTVAFIVNLLIYNDGSPNKKWEKFEFLFLHMLGNRLIVDLNRVGFMRNIVKSVVFQS